MDGSRTFQRQEQTRFKKSAAFFGAKATSDKLLTCTLAFQPALNIMGPLFTTSSSRMTSAPVCNVLAFVDVSKSPAVRSIDECMARLGQDTHQSWRPLAGSDRAWTPELYHLASVPMWVMAGHLHKRFVLPVHQWPLRLGQLVVDGATEETRAAIARDFCSCVHCGPFANAVRRSRGIACPADVLSPGCLSFFKDVFEAVPVTNVRSEQAFARSKQRRSSAAGNTAKPATLASDHVLAQAKSQVDALRRPAVCEKCTRGLYKL